MFTRRTMLQWWIKPKSWCFNIIDFSSMQSLMAAPSVTGLGSGPPLGAAAVSLQDLEGLQWKGESREPNAAFTSYTSLPRIAPWPELVMWLRSHCKGAWEVTSTWNVIGATLSAPLTNDEVMAVKDIDKGLGHLILFLTEGLSTFCLVLFSSWTNLLM